MFGSTEIQELLLQLNNYRDIDVSIVPTVLLPLAFISTGISILATYIASLFGVKLKAEGPKKLLEVLLRPKVLVSALVLNGLIFFGVKAYQYVKNGPVPLVVINLIKNSNVVSKPVIIDQAKYKWSQQIEGGVFASGAIHNEKLYVGTSAGKLFTVDLLTGENLSSKYFGKFLSPSPQIWKDHMYFGEGLHQSHHMRVYKVSLKDLKIDSTFKTKGHTEIFPVISRINDKREILFQAAGGDGLYALDPSDLSLLWHVNLGHMDGFPIVENADLYISSGVAPEEKGARPFFYKLDALTGKEIWRRELPISSWYGPVKAGENFCVIQGEIHFVSNVGGIMCFDKNGESISNLVIDAPIISKPTSIGNNIVFNDYKGNVYSWNSKTISLNWKILNKDSKKGYSSAIVKNGVVYSLTASGLLRLINMDSGVVEKEIQIDGQEKEVFFADPLFYKNGVIIFGMKGSVHFIENI